jgi:hypothetical protein
MVISILLIQTLLIFDETCWITREISHIKFYVSSNSFTVVSRLRAHDRKIQVLIWAKAEVFLICSAQTSPDVHLALYRMDTGLKPAGCVSEHTPSRAEIKKSVRCIHPLPQYVIA